MHYFDANVFLLPQLYEESIEEVRKAKEYLLKLATGEIEACTSVLTWDEVVYVVRRRAGREKASIAGRKFMSFPNLKVVPVDFRILQAAQELVEKFGLLPRDAIHAACAIRYTEGIIVSCDPDFDRVEGLRRVF